MTIQATAARSVRLVAFGATALALICLVGLPAARADSVSPVPPPAKAASPGTDLLDYPKLPVSTNGPVSSSDVGTDNGVFAVTARSGGGRDITSFTPAPGVTDEQLYVLLRGQGVADLLDPASTSNNAMAGNTSTAGSAPASPAVAACTIGTAHTNGCPGIHWANNGYAHPQVYFVDHTGSSWPVDVATYNWNQAQGIDSIYVYGSCPGYAGTHCANLYDANYGATGWAGLTYTPVDSKNNILDGQVTSKFNDYYGAHYTAAQHRQDTCHEEGHVLGLAHNDSTDSCIYYAILSSAPQHPDADDFAVLQSVYSYVH